MKRKYKASFILDTRNYQEPLETLNERLTKVIEELETQVDRVNHAGPKAFARVTDRKFPEGIYVTFYCTGPANFPAELKEKLRLDKQVYRLFVESAN